MGLVDVLTLTYHTMEQLLMQKETKASDITVSAPSNVIVDDDGHADAATPAPKTVTTAPAEDITPGPMWSRFFEHAPITEDVEARIHAANARVADTTFSAPSSIGGGCGSQSATTVVPGLVNGSGYVFKFRDPVTATLHRFTSRVVAGTAGESPLGELLAAVVAKCGCVLALEEEYDTLNATKPLFTGSSAASMNGDIASSCDDEASAFRSMAIVRQYTKNQHVRAVLKDDAAVHDEENAEEDVNAAPVYHYFRISYRDDEGDLVFLHSDADLLDAVGVARMMGWGRLVLHVDVAVDDITTGQRVPLKAHAVHSPEMTTAHDEDEELLADESVMSAVPDMSAVPAASKKSFVDMNNAMIIGAVGAAVGVLAIGVMVAKQLRGSNK